MPPLRAKTVIADALQLNSDAACSKPTSGAHNVNLEGLCLISKAAAIQAASGLAAGQA